MATDTKYLHDRSVLALLTMNSILAVSGILLILFKLDASKGSNYIIQFRSGVGIGEFKSGSALDMSGFIFFMLLSFGVSILISTRCYNERRRLALSVLMMTSLLILLAIIVSDALLVLR